MATLIASIKGMPKDPRFRTLFLQKLMARIHEEYQTKSDGGTDTAGIKWKPLSPSTRAYRGGRTGPRGLLTEKQDQMWRAIFRAYLERLSGSMGVDAAKAEAAARAWGILKARGAITKIGTLGNRDIPIMVDTGRLLAAYSPGTVVGGAYTPPNNDQIVSIFQNSIQVTIQVPYNAEASNVRPIVPDDLTAWALSAAESTIRELYT